MRSNVLVNVRHSEKNLIDRLTPLTFETVPDRYKIISRQSGTLSLFNVYIAVIWETTNKIKTTEGKEGKKRRTESAEHLVDS